MPPRWCAEGILQPRAVQATGPTNEHPGMAVLSGAGVKHDPKELRGCVELDLPRPLVPSRGASTSDSAHGLGLPRQEPRRVAPS